MIKQKIKTILLALLITSQVNAETFIVSQIVRVYDGDTFYVNLDCDIPLFCRNIGIRLNGVDTPEMRGGSRKTKALAREAKYFVFNRINNAQFVELRNVSRGKYFRIVADVFVDGDDLGAMLIDEGLGVPYFGGKKTQWK